MIWDVFWFPESQILFHKSFPFLFLPILLAESLRDREKLGKKFREKWGINWSYWMLVWVLLADFTLIALKLHDCTTTLPPHRRIPATTNSSMTAAWRFRAQICPFIHIFMLQSYKFNLFKNHIDKVKNPSTKEHEWRMLLEN